MIRESECGLQSKHRMCCCNCKNQVKIKGHPWNQDDMKAPISTVVGYGCQDPLKDMGRDIIFMDRQHGMCELHTPTDEGVLVNN